MFLLDDSQYKMCDSDVVALIKVQTVNYKNIHNKCINLLTPKERNLFNSFFDANEKIFISNISQVDNGKYITLFVPQFEIKECLTKSITHKYEIIYLKQNKELLCKEYDFLPRVIEFCDYENHRVDEYVGCHNGFGWEIISARVMEKVSWSREILY